ncbi:MAG: hypothetical protein L0H20_05950 [Corynebacterium sp.]|nr:hypothetical protein [Corynebacterium sp.]MDN5722533.1 hypothetical protein [Corynebacterium sp.]
MSGRRTAPIASLVNALEVRSRLPHPNLNLSGDRKSRGKSAGGTAVPPLNPKGAKGAKGAESTKDAAPQEPPASTDTTHTTTEDGKK